MATYPQVLRKIGRRFGYVGQKAGQIAPLFSENGIGIPLKILASEARVRRDTYQAIISGAHLHFRSFSSDLQIIKSWLKEDLAKQYDYTDKFGGIIIDAGGHIGMASIALARRFPDRKIITLEPSVENFALLVENTKAFPNITVMNCAVGPEDGEMKLFDRTGNTDGFIMEQGSSPADVEAQAQTVRVISIPTLLKEAGEDQVALLKLDIEGFEVELFSKRTEWMSDVGVLAIELHEWFRTGSTRAYINATQKGRRDLGYVGEMHFSMRNPAVQ